MGLSGGGTAEVTGSGGARPRQAGISLLPSAAPGLERIAGTWKKQVLYCYEQRIKLDPTLQGRVMLALTFIDGVPDEITIASDTVRDEGLRGCLRRRAERWRVDEPGTIEVEVPFAFSTSTE